MYVLSPPLNRVQNLLGHYGRLSFDIMYMFDCRLTSWGVVKVRTSCGGWAVDGLSFIEDICLSVRHSRLAYD